MAFVPLLSLLVAPLSFDLQIGELDGSSPLILTSPSRNITLSLHSGSLFADSIPVSPLTANETTTFSIRCISQISLHFASPHANSLVYSPTICSSSQTGLYIDESSLKGCIFDVSQSSKRLLQRSCGHTTAATPRIHADKGPIYVAEPLEVNEGASTPLQWKNVYFMPQNETSKISNSDIIFTVVEGAKHGEIRVDDVVTSSFNYAQLLARRVVYKHDSSESHADSIGFQIESSLKNKELAAIESKTFTIKVKINSVNDPPELSKRVRGDFLLVASRGSRVLTSEDLILTDSDDGPDKVRVQVVESKGVHLSMHGEKITEFSKRDLTNEMVSLVDEGLLEHGQMKLLARDGEGRSPLVILETRSSKVEVKLVRNTGVRLIHHSSVLITNKNLSFEASIPEVQVSYRIVDLPDAGVVERHDEEGGFQMCNAFTQTDIDEERIRFRHTSVAATHVDMFSFQVEAGEFASMVHVFRIDFVPMNIKVFTREPFVLNATENESIQKKNLFSWTFPKSFSPHNLVYHIDEPPKLGTLSRRIGPSKQRRMGVSSNFTQHDIDEGVISYKIHYQQFSIVNDFFLFRVVSPSVSSPLLRFDIVYVPRASSIQLINKTIVVKEGESTPVTSDFLSLTTPDDAQFVFRIVSPPMHGTLKLKSATWTSDLGKDLNFTTEDVKSGRLLYENDGGESRNDECRLLAVSRQDERRQMPFMLTVSVILLNDNAPRLSRDVIINIVERGERVLHDFLLPWIDDDLDSSALLYNFAHANKDAAILSTVSPYLPMTSFSQHEINDGRVMIRHLGHHHKFDMKYTVSDGVHTVDAVMHIVAAEPNVWVEVSALRVPCNASRPFSIRLSPANLSVTTNMDVQLSDVIYKPASSRFSVGTTRKPTSRFTQADIEKGLVWYGGEHVVSEEALRVNVADRSLEVSMAVECDRTEAKTDWDQNLMLRVPIGGAVLIDNLGDGFPFGEVDEEKVVFEVTRYPQLGYLALDYDSSSTSSRVARFSKSDVTASRVQYVQNSASTGNDSMQFIVSVLPRNFSFHVSFDIEIFERNVKILTVDLVVSSNSRSPITPSVLNVTTSENEEAVVHVISSPLTGRIVAGNGEKPNATSLDSFTTRALAERKLWYVPDVGDHNDSFAVRACVSETVCSETSLVRVIVSRKNDEAPRLVRNEILRTHSEKALITSSHLNVEDADTSSNSLIYVISKPSNGRVVRVDEIETPISNFTQFDIDQSLIAFLVNNDSVTAGGFSFVVSDGAHNIGPEWFSTEKSSISQVLETNGRLIATPEGGSIIGAEILRANLPNTRPDEILFVVSKPPRFGHLEVDGKPANAFSQTQINRRLVVYTTIGFPMDEWSRRDSFSFRVFRNTSSYLMQHDEKFRITTTYAALSDAVMPKFILTRPLIVSKGGSTAFNQSHLDASALSAVVEKEVVMVEIGTEPRMGVASWLDNQKRRVSWTELRSAFFLLYKHRGDDLRDDSLVFHVYAARESTRRSSRLRVVVPIFVRPPHDNFLQIVTFPTSLSVLNSGSTPLLADVLMTRHRTVPPQSIVYHVAQRGCNGVSIRIDDKEVRQFTQHQVNEGEVALSHAVSHFAASSFDLLVFDIEGHTRSLVVKIRPLDLALENHTSIFYPQGKTYVVVNRTHLGAFSNGDRKNIKYKITSGPENGTFYWVAGEKEAKEFTQDDIDEGRILYAQLNMHSYQDSFEFQVGNTEGDILRNSSRLRVAPLVEVQPVIVESNTATPLTCSQINASQLQDSSPRFFLTSQLNYGRLTFDPSANFSAYYFTYADIRKGIVYYQAAKTEQEAHEHIELEVRADNVQPARFTIFITVLPADDDPLDLLPAATIPTPPMDNKMTAIRENLPVIILVAILVTTLCLLVCRSRKEKKPSAAAETPPRLLPPSPRTSAERQEEKQDLLGTTVFASVRQAEDRVAMQSFQKLPLTRTTTAKPQTPVTSRRPVTSSLDYAGLGNSAPPPMRLFDQVAKTQPTNHYWV